MVRVDHLFGHDPGVTGPEDGYLDFFTKLRPVEKKHILDQQAVIKLKQEGGKDDNQQYRIGNQVLKQRVQQTNAIINAGVPDDPCIALGNQRRSKAARYTKQKAVIRIKVMKITPDKIKANEVSQEGRSGNNDGVDENDYPSRKNPEFVDKVG